MKGKLIEEIHKHYIESKRHFDAWGIVINPITYEKLMVECLEHYDANYNVLQIGELESVLGMVVILDNEVADNDAIIVDERFGRSILGKNI